MSVLSELLKRNNCTIAGIVEQKSFLISLNFSFAFHLILCFLISSADFNLLLLLCLLSLNFSFISVLLNQLISLIYYLASLPKKTTRKVNANYIGCTWVHRQCAPTVLRITTHIYPSYPPFSLIELGLLHSCYHIQYLYP